MRYVVSVLFLLAGTNVLTYAITRYWTTKRVLTEAENRASVFLQDHELMYGERNVDDQDLIIPVEADVECRRLMGQLHGAGGMYYWYNDALPHYGAGIILFAVGVVLLCLRKRKQGGGAPACEPPA